MNKPKWATLDRQHHLVRLFIRSKGFCVFGHKDCDIPEHYYEVFIEGLILDWQADDREQSAFDWQAEQRQLHSLAERRYPLRGQFSAISKDIFFANQPAYYIIGLGISGVTFRPFALIRLASSFVSLFVDIDDSLKGLSKNKRRKAIRYGKPLTPERQAELASLCRLAVRHYLDNIY
ncbi:hypothetical protein ES708_10438 [subsurface metagenome]